MAPGIGGSIAAIVVEVLGPQSWGPPMLQLGPSPYLHNTTGGVHSLAWPFSLLGRGAWGRVVRNERWWLVYRAEFLSAEGTYVICCGPHSALYYDRDTLALSIGLTGSIPYL